MSSLSNRRQREQAPFNSIKAAYADTTIGNAHVPTSGLPADYIEVDVNHLETALLNLAINARDAMPDGGKLTIEGVNVYADDEYHRRTPEISKGQHICISVS